MFKNIVEMLLNENVRPAKGMSILKQDNHGTIIKVKHLKNSRFIKNLCWFNSKVYANEHGGEVIFGWALFTIDNEQLAQHHAVWRSENGEYLDVTPNKNCAETVFLIDNRAPFDYEGYRYLPVFYKSIDKYACVWGYVVNGKREVYKDFFIIKGEPSEENLKNFKDIGYK